MRRTTEAAETTLTRSFDDLALLAERAKNVGVRIQRSDGSAIEGAVVSGGNMDLFVLDSATGAHVQVFAHELHTLDVSVPRRGREWTLAAIATPAATAALVAYAQLPWVPERPHGGEMLMGFVILIAIAAGAMYIPWLRKSLGAWLTTWQRVYPPMA